MPLFTNQSPSPQHKTFTSPVVNFSWCEWSPRLLFRCLLSCCLPFNYSPSNMDYLYVTNSNCHVAFLDLSGVADSLIRHFGSRVRSKKFRRGQPVPPGWPQIILDGSGDRRYICGLIFISVHSQLADILNDSLFSSLYRRIVSWFTSCIRPDLPPTSTQIPSSYSSSNLDGFRNFLASYIWNNHIFFYFNTSRSDSNFFIIALQAMDASI